MLKTIPKRVIIAVTSALIVAVLITISNLAWQAIKDEIRKEDNVLQCEALPVEDDKDYARCSPGTRELMRWCSGDCNHDDAKVTICCRQ